MEKNFAIVINGVVENIIVWDGQSLYELSNDAVEIPEGETAWIGLGYSEGVFEQPPEVTP